MSGRSDGDALGGAVLAGGEEADAIAGAEGVEDGADGGQGEFWRVAVGAEVSEEDVREVVVEDAADQFGGADVGEVAVAGEDSLFDGPGAAGVVLQEVEVVVGLEQDRVAAADALDGQFGGVADVGEETDAGLGVFDDEADGVVGVMGDGKGVDREVADGEPVSGVEEAPSVEVGQVLPEAIGGEAIAVEGEAEGAAQDLQAGGVVGVFVGEEDPVEVGDIQANGRQPPGDLPRAEAGVDQEAGAGRFHQRTVTGTAATQYGQLEHPGEI